ncbi:hypothetical protein CHS0354_018966 [Potamilus streckersoni]|uniref:Uncharacterized protein n=1 Tax=Potamilus streckersoni TaxID=2493646 RepID=A0AAE0W7V6_9BIVA|nr:hypothetical protein CHS0354_018966 [Potamilus streckersoni]
MSPSYFETADSFAKASTALDIFQPNRRALQQERSPIGESSSSKLSSKFVRVKSFGRFRLEIPNMMWRNQKSYTEEFRYSSVYDTDS